MSDDAQRASRPSDKDGTQTGQTAAPHPRIVMIHGAFNELWGPHEIHARWVPALRDGLWHHGTDVDPADVTVCFYGDLFRLDPKKCDDDAWRHTRAGAAEALEAFAGGETDSEIGEIVGQAASAAAWDRTVDMVAVMADNPGIFDTVLDRLSRAISSGVDVLVAHSMGTLFAYHLLQTRPDLSVETLVTLGSPLGTKQVQMLLPPPAHDGTYPWPGSVKRWLNVSAVGDHATGSGSLTKNFGDRVENHRIDNGHRAHAPEPYLNCAATGAAIAEALTSDS